jgi:hypothetical protein
MSHVRDFDDLPLWSGERPPRRRRSTPHATPSLPRNLARLYHPRGRKEPSARSECGDAGTQGCMTYEWR